MHCVESHTNKTRFHKNAFYCFRQFSTGFSVFIHSFLLRLRYHQSAMKTVYKTHHEAIKLIENDRFARNQSRNYKNNKVKRHKLSCKVDNY